MHKDTQIKLRMLMTGILWFLIGIGVTICFVLFADKVWATGPLVSDDHNTLTVKAKNGYYWMVSVDGSEPMRIDAIRDTEKNEGKLELDIRGILSSPGQHTVKIDVYNYYGTPARVTPVVVFDVFEDGTFTYRNSPLYLDMKPRRITDLIEKEE